MSRINHSDVAAIVSENLTWKHISPPPQPKTFESICFSVTGFANTIVVLLIYRPSTSPITENFFVKLSRYLEVVALYKCDIIVTGNINIHVERTTEQELLATFNCVQHVPQISTQRDGGTLDLVIRKSEQILVDHMVQPLNAISDHSVITWKAAFPHRPLIVIQHEIRSWGKLDKYKFRSAIIKSELFGAQTPASTAEYFYLYYRVSHSLAEDFAPVKKITVGHQRFAVWMDAECVKLRHRSRILERRQYKMKLPTNKQAWWSMSDCGIESIVTMKQLTGTVNLLNS